MLQLISDENNPLLPKEIPYNETSFKDKLLIIKEISFAAFNTILATFGNILKDVISLYFVGHLNNRLLYAAAGFGMTWINSFGTAVIAGFAGGFGTLASQAYGAKNYYKFGLLYQKSLVALTCVLLLVSSILWFTKAELMMFGFDEELAHEVGHFTRCLLLDLFFVMIFETTKYYLLAQNIFQVPAYILIISTTIHIFWCNLFVNTLDLGLTGIAIARTITDATSAFLILLYIKVKNPCPESWFPWVSECLQGLVPFAKLIGSHGSAIYFEWISIEISSMVLGYLGDLLVIAAHSSAVNYIFVNGSISIGLSVSTGIFVGNAAGEGSLHKTQKYANGGLISNIILISILDLFMFCFRGSIASFYTNEPEVQRYISSMLGIYFFGMHADLICNALSYILRTLGQDRFVLRGFLMSYYGVGVMSSLVFGVWLEFGYYGIWGGLVAGCIVMLILTAIKFRNLNWEMEVKKVASEMRKKSLNETEMEINKIG